MLAKQKNIPPTLLMRKMGGGGGWLMIQVSEGDFNIFEAYLGDIT